MKLIREGTSAGSLKLTTASCNAPQHGWLHHSIDTGSQYMTHNNRRLGLEQAGAGQERAQCRTRLKSAHNAAQQIVRPGERASTVIQAGDAQKRKSAQLCTKIHDAQRYNCAQRYMMHTPMPKCRTVSRKMREYSAVQVKDLLETNT